MTTAALGLAAALAAAAGAPPSPCAPCAGPMHDVVVAVRALRKGAAFSCDDVELVARPERVAPKRPLAWPCRVPVASAMLHDLAAGDAVRDDDVGPPLEVLAGAPVTMEVAVHGVRVAVDATALADARVGDLVEVRLRRPERSMQARVTGEGAVQLVGGGVR